MHVCVKVCTCMLEGERRTWRENNCIHYIIYNEYNLKSKNQQEFPGGPIVQTLHIHCQGPKSIPGQ